MGLRIGIFTNAYKPEISGVVKSVGIFRDELVRQGHAVYIFAPEAPNYEDEDYGVFRYPAIQLRASVNFPLAIPVSPFIDWVVPRLKLDILHSQHPVLLGEEAITFAKSLNLPHIFTHHTQYEEYSHYVPFNQTIVKTFTREMVRAYLARCVKVIAPSESIKTQLSRQYPTVQERLSVLPTPINLEAYTAGNLNPARIRQEYRLGDAFTFVSVGRLTPEKSFDVLLDAFAQVLPAHPETRLLIVGDGASRKDLQKQAERLQIDHRVVFAGAVDYAEVPHFLSAGNAFAFASTSETQGIVMAEGMAAGLPVVAVDAPGSRDTVINEQNGLLVDNSAEALAQGMRRLLDDPALGRAFSAEALKTAQTYSPAVLTGRLVALYEEAIDLFARQPIQYRRGVFEADEARTFPPQWLMELTGATDLLDHLTSVWRKLGT